MLPDIRYQEGGGNLISGQVQTATAIIDQLQVSAPFHSRLEPEAEGVALRRHGLQGASIRRLVVVSQWSKPKRPVR